MPLKYSQSFLFLNQMEVIMIVCISERSLYYEFQDLNSGSVELVNKEQFNTKELARDEATHRFAENSALQSVEFTQ